MKGVIVLAAVGGILIGASTGNVGMAGFALATFIYAYTEWTEN